MMQLAGGLVGIFRSARHRGGLWGYLIARTRARAAVELERERNQATAEVLQLLPAGAELLEYEREGRLRVIRKSAGGDGAVAAGPHPREPDGEVGR
jgi:hypothetical protein